MYGKVIDKPMFCFSRHVPHANITDHLKEILFILSMEIKSGILCTLPAVSTKPKWRESPPHRLADDTLYANIIRSLLSGTVS